MKNNVTNTIILVIVALAALGLLSYKLFFEKGSDFPKPQKGEVTIVELGADLCEPCTKLRPIMDDVKKELEGKAVLNSLLIDNSMKSFYNVKVIPVIIIFDKESNEVARRIFSLEEVDDARNWIKEKTEPLGVQW